MKNIFSPLNAPYYVAAPPYREISGVVRAMHYLCHALNLAGEEAYIATQGVSGFLRTPLLTPEVVQQHAEAGRREPIVIYPEVASGNPLGAINVVRYLLNIPQALNDAPLQWLPSDLIYTHGMDIVPEGMEAKLLQIPLINTAIYNSNGVDDSKRSGTLLWESRYLARGGKLLPITDNSIEISFRVPRRTPEELSALYRSAELLYTYEHGTALFEAMLCGCPVVYLPNDIWLPSIHTGYLGREGWAWGTSPEETDYAKRTVHKVAENYEANQQRFWQQLEAFIEDTQSHALSQACARRIEEAANPVQAGIKAFNAGDYETAVSHFSALLEAGTTDPLPLLYLALICAHRQQPDAAVNFIEHACTLAPDRHDFLAALGETFLKQGDSERALYYLNKAVSQQPDLFAAYPALADAMRQNGQMNEAIRLLQGAVAIPSSAQETLRELLLEWLSQQGDIETLAEFCAKQRNQITLQMLGLALLPRVNVAPERIRAAVRDVVPAAIPAPQNAQVKDPPLCVAFLVSDFRREQFTERLKALILHLPTERFSTMVLYNDPESPLNELAQQCSLLNDYSVASFRQSDAETLRELEKHGVSVLVDMDGLGARNRFALFNAAPIPRKLSWDDTALLCETGLTCIQGEALADDNLLTFALPGMGELHDFADFAITLRLADEPLHFGCLCAAVHYNRDNWRLFAKLLDETPESRLVINLAELGELAEAFIRDFFADAGVAPERLEFIHALDLDSLAAGWNRVDVGLAPLAGPGDMALPLGLWMEKPYLALAGDAPWSRRPAAWLATLGLSDYIATTPDDLLARATGFSRNPLATDTNLRQKMRALPGASAKNFALDFARRLEKILSA